MSPTVFAFGTYNTAGQRAEHERITRMALACDGDTLPGDFGCFEARSLEQLAGADGTLGAVGSPDGDSIFEPAAHCDNADYFNDPSYPQTRHAASLALIECVEKLKGNFNDGIASSSGLIRSGTIDASQVDLRANCTFVGGVSGRSKCEAIEGFGRALHGTQDFYSHSNWADSSDEAKWPSVENPPGLEKEGLSTLFDLTADRKVAESQIPPDLTTGCFYVAGDCEGRITHDVLNKDEGNIGSSYGEFDGPATPRGRIARNFWKAANAAYLDTQLQWRDFRKMLKVKYGDKEGGRMACVITRDNPVRDCG
ncbi:CinY protein [Streptomyces vinaceus]